MLAPGRQLAQEKLSRLLVTTDLAEGDGAGVVTMGLLEAAGGRRRLAGGLGGEIFAGRLAAVDLRAVCLVSRLLAMIACEGGARRVLSLRKHKKKEGPPAQKGEKPKFKERFKTFVPLNSVNGQLVLKTEFGPVQLLSDYFVK